MLQSICPAIIPSNSMVWRVQALLMLKGISGRSQQHKEMLLRMAVTGMQHLSKMPPAAKMGTDVEFAAK